MLLFTLKLRENEAVYEELDNNPAAVIVSNNQLPQRIPPVSMREEPASTVHAKKNSLDFRRNTATKSYDITTSCKSSKDPIILLLGVTESIGFPIPFRTWQGCARKCCYTKDLDEVDAADLVAVPTYLSPFSPLMEGLNRST